MVWSLTTNSRTAAAANTAKLSAVFKVGRTPKLSPATYYIDGPITTRPVNGCGRIDTDGSFGTDEQGHPTRTGAQVRIVQIGQGPCLRLSGVGFVLDDPIFWVGNGVDAIIEVEGRTDIPTGRHRFRNQVFSNAQAWVECLGGYYDNDDVFIANENHADNGIVDGCEGFNCRKVFESHNQQAVPWKFLDCVVNNSGANDKDCLLADLEHGGGDVSFIRPVINHPYVTLARLGRYSPNCSSIKFIDFNRDRMPHDILPGNYLRLLEYTGTGDYGWTVKISGTVKAHNPIGSPWDDHMDTTLAFRGCETLPRNLWRIDVPGYYSYKGEGEARDS